MYCLKCILVGPSGQPLEVGMGIISVMDEERRIREVKQLVQGHTARGEGKIA